MPKKIDSVPDDLLIKASEGRPMPLPELMAVYDRVRIDLRKYTYTIIFIGRCNRMRGVLETWDVWQCSPDDFDWTYVVSFANETEAFRFLE